MELVDVTQASSIFAGLAAVLFIPTYALVARWWKSQEGQNVMLLMFWIFMAMIAGMVGRAGYLDASRIMGIIIWNGVGLTLLWRWYLLLRAQGITQMLHRRLWPKVHNWLAKVWPPRRWRKGVSN